jgi:hypothetical protein
VLFWSLSKNLINLTQKKNLLLDNQQKREDAGDVSRKQTVRTRTSVKSDPKSVPY